MLFRVYQKSSAPTKVKVEGVDKNHVQAIYDRIKLKGNAARAWKHDRDENGIIDKVAEVDYKLDVYRQVQSAVKDIIAFTESVMSGENPPETRSDLSQAIKDSGLKIAGLPLSDVISDMIAHSDGDIESGTTWAQFKKMFVLT